MPVFWGGPDHRDRPDIAFSYRMLPPLVKALARVAAEGRPYPRLGLFYDTSTLLHRVRGDEVGGEDGPRGLDLTRPEGRPIFTTTLESFFEAIPERSWALVDGKVLVVLYSAAFASAYDQGVIDHLRQEFSSRFGRGIYLVKERSWRDIEADSTYAWSTALYGPHLMPTAALGPGYDDTPWSGRHTPVRGREDGLSYRWSQERVLAGRSRLVLIETWNELHEGTAIWETAEFGRRYIAATRTFADRLHAANQTGGDADAMGSTSGASPAAVHVGSSPPATIEFTGDGRSHTSHRRPAFGGPGRAHRRAPLSVGSPRPLTQATTILTPGGLDVMCRQGSSPRTWGEDLPHCFQRLQLKPRRHFPNIVKRGYQGRVGSQQAGYGWRLNRRQSARHSTDNRTVLKDSHRRPSLLVCLGPALLKGHNRHILPRTTEPRTHSSPSTAHVIEAQLIPFCETGTSTVSRFVRWHLQGGLQRDLHRGRVVGFDLYSANGHGQLTLKRRGAVVTRNLWRCSVVQAGADSDLRLHGRSPSQNQGSAAEARFLIAAAGLSYPFRQGATDALVPAGNVLRDFRPLSSTTTSHVKR